MMTVFNLISGGLQKRKGAREHEKAGMGRKYWQKKQAFIEPSSLLMMQILITRCPSDVRLSLIRRFSNTAERGG